MFAGTPYAHDPLGTKSSFDATTGAMLKDFYRKWYTPGNAIIVIVGDVDPVATMIKVRQWFGGISSHPLPARPIVALRPVKSENFTLDSNLPYVLGFIAYRLPGSSSPDYAATQILADVLGSQRADLYGMVPAGKALGTEFGIAETYPKASVGYGLVALPSGTDASGSLGRCGRSWYPMPKRAFRKILLTRRNAARWRLRSFNETRFRGLRMPGPMRSRLRDAPPPTKISKRSSALRSQM